jgi:hypothetical protein
MDRGGSLLLAFRIFLPDRARSDRAQVDKVGIWGRIKRDLSPPGGPPREYPPQAKNQPKPITSN